MDVSAAEIKTRPWAPRPGIGLALAGLALLGGLVFALIPFHATPSQPRGAATVNCGRPISVVRSNDPGPSLRRFLSEHPTKSDAPAADPVAVRRLHHIIGIADRYHVCHRPASVRMGIAGMLMLAGAVPLTLRRYRWPPRRSATKRADDEFLQDFGYQPALDGLRAIAITWVMTTHLGLGGVFGIGDHGVDLFFVLSGFLITTLLLREHGRTGRVNLGQFYIRRALRLFPVILLAFFVGLAIHIIGPHWFRSPRLLGLGGMLFYVSNWVHIRDVNALGILTPTWSLAIEEQFYLLWPPIVAAMFAAGKGRRQVALAAGYGAAISIVYRWVTTAGWTGAEYAWWSYDSLNRADALLIGCLLAALLSPAAVAALRRNPQVITWMSLIGLAGVAVVSIKQTVKHDIGFLPLWGLIVLEISFALIICALVTRPTSRMASVLSYRGLVWLGRRSYGLYVIHLAIITAVERNNLVSSRYPRMIVEVALSVTAAALSYRFIEAPALRLKTRFGSRPSEGPATGL